MSQFASDIAQGFIEYVGKKIVTLSKNMPTKKGHIFVMDGTGFSYHDSYPMKLFNGMDIRKIRTHVKIAVVMGRVGTRRFVVSAKAGQAYASDMTLIQPLLEQLPIGRGYVLGDKGFDSYLIMATIIEKGYRPVISIKQGRIPRRIKDPLRMVSKANADNHRIYKQMTLVEGLFGNVKQKLSSHVRIFKLEIAQVFAILRFALLNVSVLVAVEKIVLWIWFPNSRGVLTFFTDVLYLEYPKLGI